MSELRQVNRSRLRPTPSRRVCAGRSERPCPRTGLADVRRAVGVGGKGSGAARRHRLSERDPHEPAVVAHAMTLNRDRCANCNLVVRELEAAAERGLPGGASRRQVEGSVVAFTTDSVEKASVSCSGFAAAGNTPRLRSTR